MNDITISWGETFPLTVEAVDATSATLYIGLIGSPVVTKTASFVEGVADLTVSAEEMEIETGEYFYQVSVEYTNGDKMKFPDGDCLKASNELPKLTVVETIDMEGASS